MTDNDKISISKMIDHHDQPATSRTFRRRIAAFLQKQLEADNQTDALNAARRIRKSAVHSGLYVRPPRKYADPYNFRARRPVRSAPARTSAD